VAAFAAERTGAQAHIFSKPRKSEMFGAQYLHEPIPGIPPGVPQEISYQLRGSEDDYRLKVYGPGYSGPVSPGTLEEGHAAWDIRHTYDQLWNIYGPSVVPMDLAVVHRDHIPDLDTILWDFDLVINTVPLPIICMNLEHRFVSQEIAALGDAPERGQFVPEDLPDGTVICNGLRHPAWYRASKIFGHATLEWSSANGAIAPLNASRVRKPLSTTCDCWPEILRTGRYGQWKKGALVHEAYRATIDHIAGLT
jgi:hypothetical protein